MKNRAILSFFIIGILCLGGCGSSQKTVEEQQDLKEEAMELQRAGDYAGAIEKYEEAMEKSGSSFGSVELDLAYYKASAQYQMGDLSGAIDTYSAVLEIESSEEAYFGRGLLYQEAGETKKAKADLKQALSMTEDLLTKGMIYEALQDTQAAKKSYEQAKLNGDPQASYYLGKLYEAAGDPEYAQILYEEYLESKNPKAEGYLKVAQAKFSGGDYEGSLELCRQGIELGNSDVRRILLQEEIACLEKLGEYETAREKAAEYLTEYPEDTQIQKELEFLKSR